VIVTAAVTVAVHHLSVWWIAPRSVFNYDAPFWVVAVHAAFVVGESVVACFIARSFFDNVIGLERIVQARTAALDERNRDMSLVLDNVDQGFFTIDRDAVVSSEKSAVVGKWLGPAPAGVTLGEYIGQKDPAYRERFQLAWSQVQDGILPLALLLEQLPRWAVVDGHHLAVCVSAIGEGEELQRALVVITDMTAGIARERAEVEQKDVLAIMERVSRDKNSVLEFFEEAHRLVDQVRDENVHVLVDLKRAIHTLKGNCLLFGVNSVGQLCHEVESSIDELRLPPPMSKRMEIVTAFERLCRNTATFLGEGASRKVEIDDAEYEGILRELVTGAPREDLARRIRAWKLEPASRRLGRVAEQARGLARRLNKGSITVDVDDNQVLLDPDVWSPFWASFVHVVRNAVDHGLEDPDTREQHGKPRRGAITLITREDGQHFVVEIRDDGRGIDWQRLRERALSLSLPAETREDLVEALFADGVSTKDEVSDTSGRGVGMGAVREECRRRGGQMTVDSVEGGGTTIAFRFPRQSVDNDVGVVVRSAS
jgi:two-component system, chemotaxis family, sensor kinase CheA